MSRKATITTAVLEVLKAASPYWLAEAQLVTEVRGIVRPPPAPEEIKTAVDALVAQDAIAKEGNPKDADEIRFTIKEAGRGLLAQ